MPYMYILECSDGTYYTGSTWDLEKRLDEHNSGASEPPSGRGANYTRKRLPVKIVYFEQFERIESAFKREKQIQNWSHVKKKALIDANINLIHKFAICRNQSRSPSVVEEPDDTKWSSRLRSTTDIKGN